MPIVSEHPQSTEIIKRLSDECDSELEAFVHDYAKRRKAFGKASESRRAVVDYLEDEDRAGMGWRELSSLLRAREASVDELHDELELMTKEITLLKREMRRVRRKLTDATQYEEPEYELERPPAHGLPDLMSVQGRIRTASAPERTSVAWLKPWLRSFLPNSA